MESEKITLTLTREQVALLNSLVTIVSYDYKKLAAKEKKKPNSKKEYNRAYAFFKKYKELSIILENRLF